MPQRGYGRDSIIPLYSYVKVIAAVKEQPQIPSSTVLSLDNDNLVIHSFDKWSALLGVIKIK